MLPVKLTVKALDDDKRIITGIASTPTPDRMGDVVEPMGAKFRLPLPLLWQHDHRAPVGRVIEARATSEGVSFKAEIARVQEPGPLRDRIETAWGEIKAGLVGAVSIGFNALSSEALRNGGRRFKEWEFLELSLTAIPANHEAVIQQFHGKSASPSVAPSEPIMERLNRRNTEIHERISAEAAEDIAADRKPLKFTTGLLAALLRGQSIVRDELLSEIGRLEKKIAGLESRKSLSYAGVYAPGMSYEEGQCVTHKGSLWHCSAPTTSPPGESDQWRLAVKKGRDGHRDTRGANHE